MTVITRRFITHEPIIERTTDGPGFCCRCICGWRYQELQPGPLVEVTFGISVRPLEPLEMFASTRPYAESIWRDHVRAELPLGGWLTFTGSLVWAPELKETASWSS